MTAEARLFRLFLKPDTHQRAPTVDTVLWSDTPLLGSVTACALWLCPSLALVEEQFRDARHHVPYLTRQSFFQGCKHTLTLHCMHMHCKDCQPVRMQALSALRSPD